MRIRNILSLLLLILMTSCIDMLDQLSYQKKEIVMKSNWIIVIIIMSLLQSCNSQKTDKVIDRLDDVDFSELKGLFIHFRSKGHSRNSNIYFITTNKTNCSPYAVEVDKSKIDELKIKNDLVLKTCDKEYLDKETIKIAIEKYLELNICLIQVDSFGNVFINPSKQEFPTLLKMSSSTPPKNINQFELYKGSWYIRK